MAQISQVLMRFIEFFAISKTIENVVVERKMSEEASVAKI